MTVKELIEELSKFNPNDEVKLHFDPVCEDGTVTFFSECTDVFNGDNCVIIAE